MIEPVLLKAKEAASYLNIGKKTLWTLTNAKAIPHVRVGRSLRYPVDALKAWIDVQAKKNSRKQYAA